MIDSHLNRDIEIYELSRSTYNNSGNGSNEGHNVRPWVCADISNGITAIWRCNGIRRIHPTGRDCNHFFFPVGYREAFNDLTKPKLKRRLVPGNVRLLNCVRLGREAPDGQRVALRGMCATRVKCCEQLANRRRSTEEGADTATTFGGST